MLAHPTLTIDFSPECKAAKPWKPLADIAADNIFHTPNHLDSRRVLNCLMFFD